MAWKLLLLSAIISMAIATSSQVKQTRGLPPGPESGIGNDIGWTKTPWTASDTPYSKVRKAIEEAQELQRSKGNTDLLIDLTERYRNEVQDLLRMSRSLPSGQKVSSLKLVALFGFAACVHAGSVLPHSYQVTHSQDGDDAIAMLRTVENPKSYEFTRMRWLTIQDSYQGVLRDFGDRLLARQPKDYEVLFWLVRMYEDRDPKHQRRAMQLVDQLVNDFPDRPNVYFAKGDCYFLLSSPRNDWNMVRTAKQAYERYLQVAPKNSHFRETAVRRAAICDFRIKSGDIHTWRNH